jgi:hypothetical protein
MDGGHLRACSFRNPAWPGRPRMLWPQLNAPLRI